MFVPPEELPGFRFPNPKIVSLRMIVERFSGVERVIDDEA
jgi:hypothetical protein